MGKLNRPIVIDWSRLRYGGLSFVLAVLLAAVLQPKFHDNKDALAVLVNVFAILAGFMVAVMTIVADSRALRGRNWREDVGYLKQVRNELARHRMMFKTYLAVLLLAFIVQARPPVSDLLLNCGEYFLIFLSTFALLLSFRLPQALTDRHLKFLDQEIKRRRSDEQGRPPQE